MSRIPQFEWNEANTHLKLIQLIQWSTEWMRTTTKQSNSIRMSTSTSYTHITMKWVAHSLRSIQDDVFRIHYSERNNTKRRRTRTKIDSKQTHGRINFLYVFVFFSLSLFSCSIQHSARNGECFIFRRCCDGTSHQNSKQTSFSSVSINFESEKK